MASLGGYGAVNGSSSLSGGTTAPGRDFIGTGIAITTAGSLNSFNIYMNTAGTVGTVLKLKIWRLNGANYDFIGESQEFNSLSVGLNSNLSLSTPIAVQVGDLIGIHLSNDNLNNKIDADSNPGSDIVYKTGDDTTSQATSSYTTLSDLSICVEVFEAALTSKKITLSPMKNNTGAVLLNETGVTVDVYNRATGALVVRKTAQTSDASGVIDMTDNANFVPTTEYNCVVELSSGALGLEKATAYES